MQTILKMSSNLSAYNSYSSGASESIQKLVYNEHRGRKSQKRVFLEYACKIQNFERKEERRKNFKERRQQEEEEEQSYLLKYRDRGYRN